MSDREFASLHRHGMVRVAAATPVVATADPARNAQATLELARRADADGVDLVVFPELGLSSYAIDDLLLQDALLDAAEDAVATMRDASRELAPVLLVGAPVRRNGSLFNAAVVISHGAILGVVPKTFLPNYREYYEKRWFASGASTSGQEITLAGATVPFGNDLIFGATDLDDFVIAVDICEDFWATVPPSSFAALAGATVLANLSASNITVGKSADRETLSASQSMRAVAAYIYSAAGPGESSTDLAWDGQGTVHELGALIAESDRFAEQPQLLVADVDLARIRLERLRTQSFSDSVVAAGQPERRYRRVAFAHRPHLRDVGLRRPLRRFPFVPDDQAHLDQDCYEAFNIQVTALARRFRSAGERMVIGVSGGLDSTHALIVAAKACDLLEVPRSSILGFTMPGFATGEATKANAWALMKALGVEAAEIDIRPAAGQLLADLDHPFSRGEHVYDVTFENVQAGLRTDYLFRLANQRKGFVVGTGDLSELALGWSTYGVGDQMSHYAVNAGVPKTLIQYLIRWTVTSGQFDERTNELLTSILDTEISPELVPADEETGAMQSTEERIGPYELHDFFLFHVLRYGLPPSKVAFLAWHAWRDAAGGEWPVGFPADGRHAYDLPTITHWLREFLQRYFGFAQFKRSALPNGPKVSAGGALSPRGDWRAPSDASAAAWVAELDRNGPQV
ncbi:NAD(+) synthase [uncultured Jatrophihabitans sp.]|uniref:NAD(+) synthase n=1 Tax=uncultured Jatrophihabitans sp. TaxID=1610747 RepID=UPI0035C9DA79